MKSATQSGVFSTSPVTIRSAAAQSAVATQLVLRDPTGQVVQQWSCNQPKTTIGSASNCTVQCNLPGIAPLHVLVVNGARQSFVRALSPKLTQDGLAVNELLLTGPYNYFEVSGHRFELLRAEPSNGHDHRKSDRMRFALARPLSFSRPETTGRHPETRVDLQSVDAPWVSSLIRRTIEPLEAQIEALLLPIAELQAQATQAQFSDSFSVEQQSEPIEQKSSITDEISEIVARQSATMEALSERLKDVNHQLATIERIIADDRAAESESKSEVTSEVAVQRNAIEQLQTGMVAVTDSLNQLHDRQLEQQHENSRWKAEIHEQLDQFSNVVEQLNQRATSSSESDSAILQAVQSLQESQQRAQEEIQRWQYSVQEQLDALEKHLESAAQQAPTDVSEIHLPVRSAVGQPKAEEFQPAATQLTGRETPQFETQQYDTPQYDTPQFESAVEEPKTQLSYDQPSEEAWQLSEPYQAAQVDSSAYVQDSARSESDNWQQTVAGDFASAHTQPVDSSSDFPGWNQVQPDAHLEESPYSATQTAWDLESESSEPPLQDIYNNSEFEPASERGAGLRHQPQSFADQQASTDFPSPNFSPLSQQIASPNTRPSEFFMGGQSLAVSVEEPRQSSFDETEQSELSSLGDQQNSAADDEFGSQSASGKSALPSWWSDDEGEVPSESSEPTSSTRTEYDTQHDQLESSLPHGPPAEIEEESIIDAHLVASPYQTETSSAPTGGAESEDSVEQYMVHLMARMRGESVPTAAVAAQAVQVAAKAAEKLQAQKAATKIAEAAEPFDLDNYVSRSNAPEKATNINAFRELANSNARIAINRSSRQRFLSTGLYKLAISVVGMTVACVLIAINGLAMNVGLVATLASLLVALIWGYDGLMSFKPLLQSGLVLQPPAMADSDEELVDQSEEA